jgi:hypothetical protein
MCGAALEEIAEERQMQFTILRLKAGSAISVQGSHLQAPYNRISLENSRNAIERVEWVCERPYPSVKRFWRRLTRSLRFP